MTESSFKIKIPAKITGEQAIKTSSVPRKAVKRRITSEDDDDDGSDAHSPLPTIRTKHSSKRPRLSSRSESEGGHSPPARHTLKPTTAKTSSGSVVTSSKGISKKKARILSDSEDGDFVPDPEERPAVASRPKTNDIKGKGKASGGNVKIMARNESKATLPPASGTTGKKRSVEEDMDVDVTTVSAPAPILDPMTTPTPQNDPPPKKKLPTIKKKPKTDSTATPTVGSPSPGTAVAPKPAGRPGAGTPKPSTAPTAASLSKKPQAPVQATTMNPSGTGDFDLRDSNTWKSLIGKGSSSSGPRVGIEKRVSTEDRRKQLDKMRDEARLAREQKTETFDLQAQGRKIATFEKKLQNEHRVKMNGPHILGAGFLVRPVPGTRPH